MKGNFTEQKFNGFEWSLGNEQLLIIPQKDGTEKQMTARMLKMRKTGNGNIVFIMHGLCCVDIPIDIEILKNKSVEKICADILEKYNWKFSN